MNFIYFGTPDFSARCLEALLAHGLVPSAVVSNPDRPTGRKRTMTAPPVKTAVESWCRTTGKTIEVFQPEKLDSDFQARLLALKPDFFVVFAYNKIFRKPILDIPRLGTVGVHPSFLPEYRGPSPFQTALLDGRTETGVTLYLLDEGIDSGPVLARSRTVEITPADGFDSLAAKLADIGGALLIETLPAFIKGAIRPEPQDEARATFTKKFKGEDGFVEPSDLAAAERGKKEKATAIFNKIRAFTPEPGVWTMQNGKRVKLLEADLQDNVFRLVRTQEEGQRPKRIS